MLLGNTVPPTLIAPDFALALCELGFQAQQPLQLLVINISLQLLYAARQLDFTTDVLNHHPFEWKFYKPIGPVSTPKLQVAANFSEKLNGHLAPGRLFVCTLCRALSLGKLYKRNRLKLLMPDVLVWG